MIRDRFLQTWKEKMGTDEWLILQDHYDPEENLKYESLLPSQTGIWVSGEVMKKVQRPPFLICM